MSEHLCVVCPQLRQGEPRVYERPNVCQGCRARLHALLGELVELYAELPARMLPGQARAQRVSGSREAPLPLRIEPLDLSMPARATEPSDEARKWPEDQVGDLSVASRLDSWVSDWRGSIGCGDVRPAPTVVELVRWLRIWLERACDQHPAIEEFATELRELLRSLRPSSGIRPELKRGVPCKRCDKVTLFRKPASDFIECGSCGLLLTPDEYTDWTGLISDKEWRPWVESVVAPQRPIPLQA